MNQYAMMLLNGEDVQTDKKDAARLFKISTKK